MTGVPSGPGSRPTDEAASCTASSPEASIPNAVLLQALRLTESNLTSLINAKHSDAVLMTDWREVVRKALGGKVPA